MNPDPFHPDSLGRAVTAADLDALTRITPGRRLPAHAPGEQFLGPIPLGWLSRTAGLPGKALHLGLALWFAAVRSKGKKPTVALSDQLCRRFGLGTRTTRTRALAALRGAGLIHVEGRVGRSPRVTFSRPTRPSRPATRCDRAIDRTCPPGNRRRAAERGLNHSSADVTIDTMATGETISEVLRRAIRESGLPLLRIAEETGVDRASISRFVRGERSLRLDAADKLAVYLGLTLTPNPKG